MSDVHAVRSHGDGAGGGGDEGRQPELAREVIALIESELRNAPPTTPAALRIAAARRLQESFRREPLGGRLLPLKRLVHWFVASAFDRQGKVVDELLAALDELALEGPPGYGGLAAPAASAAPPASTASPPPDADALASSVARALAAGGLMLPPERLLLYALVYGLQPKSCLEIGTFQGGSAAIVVAALDARGAGRLACVDPAPQVPAELWARLRHRAVMVASPSPEGVRLAAAALAAPVDFALVDGDHSTEGVVRDGEALLPHLAREAHLLFHDSHHPQVRAGIDALLARHGAALADAGGLSSQVSDSEGGPWGGLRLLRFHRR